MSQSLLAARHNFSQLTASFIASRHLGIRLMLFFGLSSLFTFQGLAFRPQP